MRGVLRLGVFRPFSVVPLALLHALRRRAFAVSATPLDPVPIGGIVFDTSGSILYGSDNTVGSTQDVPPDASHNRGVSGRLFERHTWFGTWVGTSGALPFHRRRLGGCPYISSDTVVSGRLLAGDAWFDTVVSGQLLARDAWPGTWLWRPVAAPVVGLL